VGCLRRSQRVGGLPQGGSSPRQVEDPGGHKTPPREPKHTPCACICLGSVGTAWHTCRHRPAEAARRPCQCCLQAGVWTECHAYRVWQRRTAVNPSVMLSDAHVLMLCSNPYDIAHMRLTVRIQVANQTSSHTRDTDAVSYTYLGLLLVATFRTLWQRLSVNLTRFRTHDASQPRAHTSSPAVRPCLLCVSCLMRWFDARSGTRVLGSTDSTVGQCWHPRGVPAYPGPGPAPVVSSPMPPTKCLPIHGRPFPRQGPQDLPLLQASQVYVRRRQLVPLTLGLAHPSWPPCVPSTPAAPLRSCSNGVSRYWA
jgi:hypothetical protein